jgi:hypothetical protein
LEINGTFGPLLKSALTATLFTSASEPWMCPANQQTQSRRIDREKTFSV